MSNENAFRIIVTSWQESQDSLRSVREAVFIKEQRVPLELEWDGEDPDCIHVLALDTAGNPIGTGRLMQDGHIGRMAVLSEWRHKGVGSAILAALIQLCLDRHLSTYLDAQLYAMDFYRKHGFQEEGEVFMDAGIPHKRMILSA